MSFPKYGDVTCSNCQTLHERVPVEYDEDGGHLDLDTVPCHLDTCTVKLCSVCPQFSCDFCGLTHCKEHEIQYSGDRICPCCMAAEVANQAEVAEVSA